MMQIDGIPPSTELLATLAAEGRKVILNFSRGKDSIAVWLKLRDYGIECVPIHKSIVPGLRFVRENLDYWEDFFGQHIIDLPADAFYRMLGNLVFQPPDRCAVIEAADLPLMDREAWDSLMRDHYAEPDTWIVDGVRASDSATRLIAIKRHGPVKHRLRRQSPLWDWSKKEVMTVIDQAGARLPIDYQWFGRSLDGIRYDYLGPIHDNAPDDYQRIIEWFPLAELELFRHERMGA